MNDRRGITPVISTILLVAIAVVIGATVLVGVGAYLEPVETTPLAAISVEETQLTVDNGNCDGYGDREVALEVTLTHLERADEIYVVVIDEGGEQLKTVYDDPTDGQVGTERILVNEDEEEPNWIDIGKDGDDGGTDWGLCPGETATFRFFGKYDGETWLIKEYTVD